MQVGAVSFQPYIFNTNNIGSASMNKVQPIPDDLTSQKTDYSGLVQSEENTNPLRRGESSNYADIIQSQMAMSQNNASRVMKPQEIAAESEAMTIDDVSADMAANVEDMAMDTNADDIFAGADTAVNEGDMAIETESTMANANMNVDTEVFDTAAAMTDSAATAGTVASESGAATGIDAETSDDAENVAGQSAATDQSADAEAAAVTNAGTGIVTEPATAAGSAAESNMTDVTGYAAESNGATYGNTQAAGTVPNGVENFTIGNNTAAVQEAAAATTEASASTQPQARSQFTDMLNLFQMRRATEAYSLSMGM